MTTEFAEFFKAQTEKDRRLWAQLADEEWAGPGVQICAAPHPEVPSWICRRQEGHLFPFHGMKMAHGDLLCWRSPPRPHWSWTLYVGKPTSYLVEAEELRRMALHYFEAIGRDDLAREVENLS